LKHICFKEAPGVLKFLLEAVWVDYGSLWKNQFGLAQMRSYDLKTQTIFRSKKPVFSLRTVICEFFQKKFKHTRSDSFSKS